LVSRSLLIIDAFLNLIHGEASRKWYRSSFDFKHLKKICTPIATLANYHPFFKIFKTQGKTKCPFYRWRNGN